MRVLKQERMPRIRIEDQFRIRRPARDGKAVIRGNHHVCNTIGDQDWHGERAEARSCRAFSLPPRDNRFPLSDSIMCCDRRTLAWPNVVEVTAGSDLANLTISEEQELDVFFRRRDL